MRLAAVVLAGGESRRMGGGKPQRMLGGRTLLDRAVALARAITPDVAIAVRTADGETGLPRLQDDPAIPGPLAGLASALDFASARAADAVLLLPCDAPFLPADLAPRLAAALAGDPAACAVPRSGDHIHPTCALWRTGLAAELVAYAATGRRSLKGFAEAVGWTPVDWPADPDPFFNINTPEDLAAAELFLNPSHRSAGERAGRP